MHGHKDRKENKEDSAGSDDTASTVTETCLPDQLREIVAAVGTPGHCRFSTQAVGCCLQPLHQRLTIV